jgi:hypothetical protein
MQDLGFLLSILQLKLEVAMITHSQNTSYKNSFPNLRLARMVHEEAPRALCVVGIGLGHQVGQELVH